MTWLRLSEVKGLTALVALVLTASALATERLDWFEGARPGRQATQAVDLLNDAHSHGLEQGDYMVSKLKDAVQHLQRQPSVDAAAAAELDRALTMAMLRYLNDLHRGRIAVKDLPRGYTVTQRNDFDPALALRAALVSGRLPEAVRDAAPRNPQYQRLREALAQYRRLVGNAAWQVPLPPPSRPHSSAPKLEPGETYAGLTVLRDRLIALGDVSPNTPASAFYVDSVVDGIRSFQQRHGLAVDGVIGKATFAQLNVPPTVRVRQIELTMERLRWTPLLHGPRIVVINIPEFVLRAYEVEGNAITVRSTMRIIVGKALDTHTPVFEEQMRFIEFQPYWNVPRSIARGELVPRLRRDPGYFERGGFEFVTASGGVVSAMSSSLLDQVIAGQARIRQRPGPRNALGDIKFVFPNRDNIYLHHTPSVQLFGRDRRDFSHGCIRVEQPIELALFALQGMPEWTEQRIRQAMTEGNPSTVKLSQPIPVVIAYGTAIVKQGRVHFFDDIYGHDRRLDAALRERRPQTPTNYGRP